MSKTIIVSKYRFSSGTLQALALTNCGLYFLEYLSFVLRLRSHQRWSLKNSRNSLGKYFTAFGIDTVDVSSSLVEDLVCILRSE